MNRLKKYFFIGMLLTFSFFQVACSTKTLQHDRLNLAENYIEKAEGIIANSRGENDKILAQETLGTAQAYLETLRDNRKFLTEQEQKRRLDLKQRAEELSKVIYQ